MAIKHAFVSAIPDGPDTTLQRPSDWNADHDVEPLELNALLAAPTADKQFYVATWGDDANDGRSWLNAKLTPAAGHALLTGNLGDLNFGAGAFTIADTITLGQSQRWHGRSWHTSAGHGTQFTWTGADDGRAMFSFSGSTDATKVEFENFRIIGAAGMTGGGACLDLRNLQNGSIIKNVHVTSWANGPSFLLRDSIADSVNYPGYVILENCWASGISSYGFRIESGTTGILMINCACDSSTGQIAPFYFRQKSETPVAITACSQVGNDATYTAAGHGLAAGSMTHVKGVTPTGYNGMYRVVSVAANDFVLALNRTGLAAGSAFGTSERKRAGTRGVITMLNCKSECDDASQPSIISETNQQIIVIGLNSRAVSADGTAPMIQWDGGKLDDVGEPLILPPISVIGCHAQNRGVLLRADRFGPDDGTFEIINSDPGGGRSCIFNFLPGYTYTPALDFVSMTTPASPEANNKRMFMNSATGQLSVVDSAGAVASLGGPGTADTVQFGSLGLGLAPAHTLDVGTAIALSGGLNAAVARLGGNVDSIAGFQMANAHAGTSADFRFIIRDSTDHYLAFSQPGANNSAVLFGITRKLGDFIFSNGGTGRSLAIGTVQAQDMIFGTTNIERMRVLAGGGFQMTEITAPAAPSANRVRVYADDNGSGKTRLMALFPTGAAVQIAIEP